MGWLSRRLEELADPKSAPQTWREKALAEEQERDQDGDDK